MSYHLSLVALAAACLAVSPSHAQSVTGGEIEIMHSLFLDDSDFAKSGISGSVELGFSREFGLQTDVALNRFGFISETSQSATLHGIYHLSPETSLGLYYGIDRLAGQTLDFYGLEAGYGMQNFGMEVHAGRGEFNGVSGSLVGLEGNVGLSEVLTLGASVDRANIDGLQATRLGLSGDYSVGQNTVLTGEIGSLRGEVGGVGETEPFIGLGIKFNFGAERGTTFGRRGLTDFLPGG